jgi:hypothetical protein
MASKTSNFVTSTLITATAYLALKVSYPQFLAEYRLSRIILVAVAADLGLFVTWITLVYPALFDPLRHLPGPKV